MSRILWVSIHVGSWCLCAVLFRFVVDLLCVGSRANLHDQKAGVGSLHASVLVGWFLMRDCLGSSLVSFLVGARRCIGECFKLTGRIVRED